MVYIKYNTLIISYKIKSYKTISMWIKGILSIVSLATVYSLFKEFNTLNGVGEYINLFLNIAASIILATQDYLPWFRDIDTLKVMQSKLNSIYQDCEEFWIDENNFDEDNLKCFITKIDKQLTNFRTEYADINLKCKPKKETELFDETKKYFEFTYEEITKYE